MNNWRFSFHHVTFDAQLQRNRYIFENRKSLNRISDNREREREREREERNEQHRKAFKPNERDCS